VGWYREAVVYRSTAPFPSGVKHAIKHSMRAKKISSLTAIASRRPRNSRHCCRQAKGHTTFRGM
jgi:hypothetical protein